MHNHELHPQNFSAQNINDEAESIIHKLLDSDVLPIQIRKFLFTDSADASWTKLEIPTQNNQLQENQINITVDHVDVIGKKKGRPRKLRKANEYSKSLQCLICLKNHLVTDCPYYHQLQKNLKKKLTMNQVEKNAGYVKDLITISENVHYGKWL